MNHPRSTCSFVKKALLKLSKHTHTKQKKWYNYYALLGNDDELSVQFNTSTVGSTVQKHNY
jgi:hypothetical protein